MSSFPVFLACWKVANLDVVTLLREWMLPKWGSPSMAGEKRIIIHSKTEGYSVWSNEMVYYSLQGTFNYPLSI